jgi:hypothetical protein
LTGPGRIFRSVDSRHASLLALIAFVIGVAAVIWLSLSPGSGIVPEPWDKLMHALAYLALTAVAAGGFSRRSLFVVCALALLALGFVLEMAQVRVPGRQVSMPDALANGCGVALGAVLGFVFRRKRPTSAGS